MSVLSLACLLNDDTPKRVEGCDGIAFVGFHADVESLSNYRPTQTQFHVQPHGLTMTQVQLVYRNAQSGATCFTHHLVIWLHDTEESVGVRTGDEA